jgi:hypothetical protein
MLTFTVTVKYLYDPVIYAYPAIRLENLEAFIANLENKVRLSELKVIREERVSNG